MSNKIRLEIVFSIIFLALSAAAFAALFFANEFYFKPLEKGTGERTLISFEPAERDKADNKLQEIDKELQENAIFIELEQQGEWPPALEKVKKENLNPFSKPAEKIKK